jgi:hypothetical protein
MKRIDHPHLLVDGICGEAGVLHGHFHASCPKDGLTWQCGALHPSEMVPCGRIFQISWKQLDDLNSERLKREPSECIELPPCPDCGGVTMLNINDVEYGLELPEHHTMKILREHVAPRKALNVVSNDVSRFDGKHQGVDFSHLPARQRPPQHRKVDLPS